MKRDAVFIVWTEALGAFDATDYHSRLCAFLVRWLSGCLGARWQSGLALLIDDCPSAFSLILLHTHLSLSLTRCHECPSDDKYA